jgi:ubiquinol-cytochrome c reductase cytochrome b subunit
LTTAGNRAATIFGTRDWIRGVLIDFQSQFAPLANRKGDQAEVSASILNGTMADWSATHGPKLKEPENAEDFTALVEFLYAQSRRPDALSPDDPQVQRGQKIFTTGKLTNGEIDACADCHSMRALEVANGAVVPQAKPLSEGLQPVLTGYGGTDWLKAMIANPHQQYAGEFGSNAMPAFADQLTAGELSLVARWLAKDYYLPATESEHGLPQAE